MYHLMCHFKSSCFVTWSVDVFPLTHVKRNRHLNSFKQWSFLWRRKRFSSSEYWGITLYLDECYASMSAEENSEEVASLQVDTACYPHSPPDLFLSKFSSLVLRPPNYIFFKIVHFNTIK
jgi:hypothetical protein